MRAMFEGVLILDKPAGMTSAAAVNRVKRLLPRGTKIGHAGSLDPFATGVLVLLIGKATKRCEELMDQPKQYEATIKLGATTETDDPESPERITRDVKPIDRAQIELILPRFVGAIEQLPPVYSALKIKGKRACDRVRAGQQVTLKSRIVQVYGIELLRYEWPELDLRIDCGRGTYIRSLARDIGAALNLGGYLLKLRRTRVGTLDASKAYALESLTLANITKAISKHAGI
jgi:tRNA pseudouridine55 synthase